MATVSVSLLMHQFTKLNSQSEWTLSPTGPPWINMLNWLESRRRGFDGWPIAWCVITALRMQDDFQCKLTIK